MRRSLTRRCLSTSARGQKYKWHRPTPTRDLPKIRPDDHDEYYDEYEDDGGLDGTNQPNRWRGEHIKRLTLPPELERALDEHTVPALRARRHREHDLDAPPDVHDFATHRLDLMYAASHRVLHEARVRLPGLAPQRALDFGAGLAPFAWATHALWGADDSPETVAVEPNPQLSTLGKTLAAEASLSIRWTYNLPSLSDEAPFDLVSAAYTLAPLPPRARDAAISSLWERTASGGLLALIEPATPKGFDAMLQARELLINGGSADDGGDGDVQVEMEAQIIAPCPHASSCPLTPGLQVLPWQSSDKRPTASSCHVEQVVAESVARRYIERARRRGNEAKPQIERFCYLLVRRNDAAAAASDEVAAPWARVLRPPRKRAGHVLLDLCLPSGEATSSTASAKKLDHNSYRLARKVRAGDTWYPESLKGLSGEEAVASTARGWGGAADEEEEEEYYEDIEPGALEAVEPGRVRWGRDDAVAARPMDELVEATRVLESKEAREGAAEAQRILKQMVQRSPADELVKQMVHKSRNRRMRHRERRE